MRGSISSRPRRSSRCGRAPCPAPRGVGRRRTRRAAASADPGGAPVEPARAAGGLAEAGPRTRRRRRRCRGVALVAAVDRARRDASDAVPPGGAGERRTGRLRRRRDDDTGPALGSAGRRLSGRFVPAEASGAAIRRAAPRGPVGGSRCCSGGAVRPGTASRGTRRGRSSRGPGGLVGPRGARRSCCWPALSRSARLSRSEPAGGCAARRDTASVPRRERAPARDAVAAAPRAARVPTARCRDGRPPGSAVTPPAPPRAAAGPESGFAPLGSRLRRKRERRSPRGRTPGRGRSAPRPRRPGPVADGRSDRRVEPRATVRLNGPRASAERRADRDHRGCGAAPWRTTGRSPSHGGTSAGIVSAARDVAAGNARGPGSRLPRLGVGPRRDVAPAYPAPPLRWRKAK